VASDLAYPQKSVEEIEALADKLLQDYARHVQAPSITPPVPIEDIAEHYLGYSIELTNEGIFADPEMLGGIDFDNKVIFVNVSVEDHDGRYSFTVAHEIGHHVLHRDVFLKHRKSGHDEILCRDTKQKPLIEMEADKFAAALLMPSQAILEAVQALDTKPRVVTMGQARGLAAKVVKESRFDNVSNSAMMNRLIDLSIIPEHIGYQTGVYRRGRKTHSFARLVRGLLCRLGL
jgi:Zn-dependent peptidase ImmA (M78 family)